MLNRISSDSRLWATAVFPPSVHVSKAVALTAATTCVLTDDAPTLCGKMHHDSTKAKRGAHLVCSAFAEEATLLPIVHAEVPGWAGWFIEWAQTCEIDAMHLLKVSQHVCNRNGANSRRGGKHAV